MRKGFCDTRQNDRRHTELAHPTALSNDLFSTRVLPRAVRRTVAVVLGSLLIAICAHVAVPLFFTPVPLTLQPFAVLLVGLFLGPAMGAATCAAYLLEGAIGLPVFTPQGAGGMLQLLGPTGGYLLAYPAAAALAGWLARLSARPGLGAVLLAALTADALILVSGTCWLAVLTHQPAAQLLHAAVIPFLPGEAIKVTLAALLASAWMRSRFDQAHRPSVS